MPPRLHPVPDGGDLLRVDALEVEIEGRDGKTALLHQVSFAVRRGEMHGLVGETGSGKSMTARSIVALLPREAKVVAGHVFFSGEDIVGSSEAALRRIRGPQIGMVFQNPRTALHPMLTVQTQIENVLRAHTTLKRAARQERILEYLSLVGISDQRRVAHAYPHELSGGMAQRVVIATALICEPALLIADEPTTGLDATVQRQILDLLAELQDRLSLAVLMITHDLSIVAQYCDSVSVMHDGRVVEDGPMRRIVLSPTADYTRRLIAASVLKNKVDLTERAPA